jgi:hypothetical protein
MINTPHPGTSPDSAGALSDFDGIACQPAAMGDRTASLTEQAPNLGIPLQEDSAEKMQGVSSRRLNVVPSASIHDVQAERVIRQPDETLDRSRGPLTSGNSLADNNRCFSFGPFRLIPAQRLLLEGETEVRLGSRAFDILVTMVEQPGELVSKAKLMARVWPNTIVLEANLCSRGGVTAGLRSR